MFGIDADGNHVSNSNCYKDDDAEDLEPVPGCIQVILIKCQLSIQLQWIYFACGTEMLRPCKNIF